MTEEYSDSPIRPRSHVIETISERYFKNNVPAEWIVNSFKLDYGTDYNCEITKNSFVTGVNFSVQLKGKDTENKKDQVSVLIKKTTINRWMNRLEPTMLIIYIADEDEAYWCWIQEKKIDLTKATSTYTINIDKINKLSLINWEITSKYVEQIFSRKHHLYSVPDIDNDNKSAWELYFKQEYQKALPYLYELYKLNNNDALVLEAIAICEYQSFNYPKALRNINKALELTENNHLLLNKASILTEFGFLSKNFEQLNQASQIYKNLISNNYNSYTVFYNYASLLSMLEDYKQSVKYFITAININPNKDHVWNNLGNAYMNLGEYEFSINCYDNSLRINPDSQEAMFSKGSCLLRYFNEVDEGLNLMLKSTELSDRHELDNPNVFFWIAEAYLIKDNYDRAIHWNKKGLTNFASDPFLTSQTQRISQKFRPN